MSRSRSRSRNRRRSRSKRSKPKVDTSKWVLSAAAQQKVEKLRAIGIEKHHTPKEAKSWYKTWIKSASIIVVFAVVSYFAWMYEMTFLEYLKQYIPYKEQPKIKTYYEQLQEHFTGWLNW